jgi:dTDP-4-amino-4,6-dideoxygalactose transaminase
MLKSIPFNKYFVTGKEEFYIHQAISNSHLCGDGPFTKKCTEFLKGIHPTPGLLLTPSCTHALELAALLIDIKPGDEVIMPSFTFVSTANAFALRGAEIVFVDVNPNNLNIDENLIEIAITSKTKAIVPMHYAGVMCEMDTIMEIANKYNLFVIEDAAQAITSSYKNKPAGTYGHYSALSFHETKNCTSGGEGGALLINDQKNVAQAEVLREKGTDRSKFLRGEVDKYSWVDVGSSFLLSEIQAAFLYAQLEHLEDITNRRLALWNRYHKNLSSLADEQKISLLECPNNRVGNGHIFAVKTKDFLTRNSLLEYLKKNGVQATFHYVPLHSSNGALGRSRFHGSDIYTTTCSEKLIRLPMFAELSHEEVDYITELIRSFFK